MFVVMTQNIVVGLSFSASIAEKYPIVASFKGMIGISCTKLQTIRTVDEVQELVALYVTTDKFTNQ